MKYDLAIIGGGSAAFAAAIKANDLKIKTVLINKGPIGGTCVNVGCVPSKRMLEVAKLNSESKLKRYKGLNITADLNFKKVIEEKNKLVQGMRTDKYANVLKSLQNVTVR